MLYNKVRGEVMLITMEKLNKSFNEKVILKDVAVHCSDNDKIGIIGVNGTGKSTLLKILAEKENIESGSIIKTSGKKIIYLPQNPDLDENKSILQVVHDGFDGMPKEFKEFEVKAILNKLGISDFDQTIVTLSGGQKKRVALACVLLRESDCLLLDEPTNHLDSEMVSWLEKRLVQYNGNILMVTHDRYFLDRVCNRIIELDHGNCSTFQGGYANYLKLKAQQEEMAIASERKRQSLLRVESEWIMRGALARGTKSKERIERFNALNEQNNLIVKSNVTLTTMESRLGRKTIEIEDLSMGYDKRNLFHDFSYTLLRNDRIGIVGPNGCGKTTLLNILAGKIKPESGIINLGETVKIGYFAQMNEDLDPNKRVIDTISECSDAIETTEGVSTASQMCEKFLFSSKEQYGMVSRLSGGEKRRLYLLKVLMSKPNILFFDEPTNDLDIQTLTILEDFLETFNGAVITISHDRYFLDKVVDKIFAFQSDGTIKSYPGGYSDYEEKCVEVEKSKTEKKTVERARNSHIPQMNSKEKKEFETIDESLANVEEELNKVDEQIAQFSSDFEKLQELGKLREELELKQAHIEERWLYLNDLNQQIQEYKNNK